MNLALVLALLLLLQVGSSCARCFCQVSGELDDCACDVETIDRFNNEQMFPKLQTLLQSDYFRFYKVNLNKACPFWTSSSHCGLRDCAVKPCSPNEVPEGIRTEAHNKYSAEANADLVECERSEELGAVDSSLSDETREALKNWTKHDDETQRFCVLDDEAAPDSEFVDLLLNPERFTGYKGPEAWRIWTSIYEENCFNSSSSSEADVYTWLEVCGEKSFYRLISGLHASINIHLSARYLLNGKLILTCGFEKKWGPNVTEFQTRFDSELTQGEGPKRLRNLYFLFLIELRALAKALPVISDGSFRLYTGQPRQTGATRSCCWTSCTPHDSGLGTALKILFSSPSSLSSPLTLNRQELVSLVNAFGRISTSIRELKNFREILSEDT
ncbi:hypothetical protein WMY93_006227 [Mugilogobius chulae]|uniref:ERO1-like protein alpha n=1 Tax=Mugilogobius chulae TaxID=88201 RepID=A0AAW0PLV0_9GOBI